MPQRCAASDDVNAAEKCRCDPCVVVTKRTAVGHWLYPQINGWGPSREVGLAVCQ